MSTIKQRKNRVLKIGRLSMSILLMSFIYCSVCQGRTHIISSFKNLEDMQEEVDKDPTGFYRIDSCIYCKDKEMASIKGFKGTLTAGNNVISHLKIKGSGLFETLEHAGIENLGLADITVTPNSPQTDNVGCLAGKAIRGEGLSKEITGVEVCRAIIEGKNNIGGLIGHNVNVPIEKCYVTGTKISGKGDCHGGLIGIK